MPLSWAEPSGATTLLRCAPSLRAVVSWNAPASAEGRIELRGVHERERRSTWFTLAAWKGGHRRSEGGHAHLLRLEVDELRAAEPLLGVEIRSDVPLDAIALATPRGEGGATARREDASGTLLAVPMRTQYVEIPFDLPLELATTAHGWCSPASLGMLLDYNGVVRTRVDVAAGVFDEAYRGTGNWAFNAAYAGGFGLRAFVAYLDGIAHAERFVAVGIPLALSFSWGEGQLRGAPRPQCDGHVAVLCGFDRDGDPVFNDPAQPELRAVYPRSAFERCWLAHGGVAYVVAARARDDVVALANA